MKLQFRLSDLYLIRKDRLASALFLAGILIAFIGSLNPWFMWWLGSLYPIPACMCLIGSYLLTRNTKMQLYTRQDYFLPILSFILLAIYERFSTGGNINGFIVLTFKIILYSIFFRVATDRLQEAMAFICKFMAVLLTISLAGHFLYIIGFSLPGRDVQFGEWYSFTNHYLFLLDDRSIFALVPRFNSFFLEPSHIGTAAAFLLLTQIGKWRKWYCIVLFTTIFFTFSLAAYVFTIFNLFFSLWIQHKQMFRKLVITISLVVVAVITTFTYNNGDNLVHNLILLRLEVKGDKMSGDNRVTEGFEAEYDSFATTSDIIFGRDMDNAEFGNAGYRVFIYENGIVGVVLLIMFYTLSLIHATNKRALISAYLIALLYFWVEAKMLQDNIFISIYAIAYLKQFAHIS